MRQYGSLDLPKFNWQHDDFYKGCFSCRYLHFQCRKSIRKITIAAPDSIGILLEFANVDIPLNYIQVRKYKCLLVFDIDHHQFTINRSLIFP